MMITKRQLKRIILEERARLPETTRLADLVFQITGSGAFLNVIVRAGKGTERSVYKGTGVLGTIESVRADQDDMPDSIKAGLRAFGESVGNPDIGAFTVGHSDLRDNFHGYGVGKRAYVMLLKEAYKRGHAIGPDASWHGRGFAATSNEAQRVWKSLGKMAGVTVIDDGPFYYGNPKLNRIGPDRPRGFRRGKKKYDRNQEPPIPRTVTEGVCMRISKGQLRRLIREAMGYPADYEPTNVDSVYEIIQPLLDASDVGLDRQGEIAIAIAGLYDAAIDNPADIYNHAESLLKADAGWYDDSDY